MKRLVSLVTTIVMLAAVGINGLSATVQQSNADQDPFAAPRATKKETIDKLPPVVKRARSKEAKDAWEKLPPELREVVKAEVDKIIEQEETKFHQKKREEKANQKAARKTLKDAVKGKQDDAGLETSLSFSDKDGNRQFFKGKEREVDVLPVTQVAATAIQSRPSDNSGRLAKAVARRSDAQWGDALRFASGFAPIKKASYVSASAPLMAQGGGDGDLDGLPEDFENALADAFTPIYHVSAYEPKNYATFNNSVPQTVLQRFGPNPVSYFRVQPLGFAYANGNQLVSVIRIDYLSLWDYDNGLVTGGNCGIFPGLNALQGMRDHEIDNERSAVLVAAPVWSYNFNLNPWSYSAYDYYTAAHENEINSKSAYHTPYQPVPAGWHLHLAQSLSKHATYTFNPDYLSLLPDELIFAILASADFACYFAAFDSWTDWRNYVCLGAIYYAYGLIYECAVERFVDQGGRFADLRINVGEPNNPINGSAFIQDNTYGLANKLTTPVWLLN